MNVVFRNSYEIKCGHDRADECTLYIRIIICGSMLQRDMKLFCLTMFI